jgi:hypothetical protein
MGEGARSRRLLGAEACSACCVSSGTRAVVSESSALGKRCSKLGANGRQNKTKQGQDRTGHGRAGQGRAGQGRAGQDRAERTKSAVSIGWGSLQIHRNDLGRGGARERRASLARWQGLSQGCGGPLVTGRPAAEGKPTGNVCRSSRSLPARNPVDASVAVVALCLSCAKSSRGNSRNLSPDSFTVAPTKTQEIQSQHSWHDAFGT